MQMINPSKRRGGGITDRILVAISAIPNRLSGGRLKRFSVEFQVTWCVVLGMALLLVVGSVVLTWLMGTHNHHNAGHDTLNAALANARTVNEINEIIIEREQQTMLPPIQAPISTLPAVSPLAPTPVPPAPSAPVPRPPIQLPNRPPPPRPPPPHPENPPAAPVAAPVGMEPGVRQGPLPEHKTLWASPSAAPFSCDALFGNGFTRFTPLCDPSPGMGAIGSKSPTGSSGLACWHNTVIAATVCQALNIAVDVNKISVSRGGEPIESVLHRSEDAEFPVYADSAFSVACSKTPMELESPSTLHHMAKMLKSMTYSTGGVGSLRCERWVDEPTLFITRYEYANLYHTMTDWWNAFQTRMMFVERWEKVRVVFFDGHSAGTLDDVWPKLFGGDTKTEITYIKSLPTSGRTCYKHALFVPPGYQSTLGVVAMREATQGCKAHPLIRDFTHKFLAAHGIEPNVPEPTAATPDKRVVRVLFIFRSDYLAHPRLVTTRASRKILNEKELVAAASTIPTAEVRSVNLERMTVEEQLKAVRQADILIGVHGAGLSYSLFINEQVGALLELFPSGYRGRYHFRYFAGWAGMSYTDFDIDGVGSGGGAALGADTDYMVPVAGFRTILQSMIADAITRRYHIPRTDAGEFVKVPIAAPALPAPPAPAPAPAPAPPAAPPSPPRKSTPILAGDTGLSPAGDVTAFDTPDKHRLALIVPFRDSVSKTSQGHNRTANLREFVPFMVDFLTKAGRKDFDIVVVEQTQGHIFNKGALFNAGFRTISHDFDYMCLHDVDQLPESSDNKYTFPTAGPVHLCSASSQFDYKMAYGAMVGGALLITRDQFRTVNGYSNFYWGWGQEDDDFYFRLRRALPNLDRASSSEGRYKALTHPRVMDLDNTKVFTQGKQHLMDTQSGALDIKSDGLSNLKATVIKDERVGPHYRHVTVQLEFKWMPTRLDEVDPSLPPTSLRP